MLSLEWHQCRFYKDVRRGTPKRGARWSAAERTLSTTSALLLWEFMCLKSIGCSKKECNISEKWARGLIPKEWNCRNSTGRDRCGRPMHHFMLALRVLNHHSLSASHYQWLPGSMAANIPLLSRLKQFYGVTLKSKLKRPQLTVFTQIMFLSPRVFILISDMCFCLNVSFFCFFLVL